jgi:hypothetical protein
MDNCDGCYKIICQNCQWEAKGKDILAIQAGFLKECPICGWMPGDPDENEAEIII